MPLISLSFLDVYGFVQLNAEAEKSCSVKCRQAASRIRACRRKKKDLNQSIPERSLVS
jgi:hypothetical protein